jgi:hypothetical protein
LRWKVCSTNYFANGKKQNQQYLHGLFFYVIFFSACCVFNDSKYNFNDGYYSAKISSQKKKYYVINGSDSIKIYPLTIETQIADTIHSLTVSFPSNAKPMQFANYSLKAGKSEYCDRKFANRINSFRLRKLVIIFYPLFPTWIF